MSAVDQLRRCLTTPSVAQVAKALSDDLLDLCHEFSRRSDPLGMSSSFPRMTRLIAIRAHKPFKDEANAFEALHSLLEASRSGIRWDGDTAYSDAIGEFECAAAELVEWARRDCANAGEEK